MSHAPQQDIQAGLEASADAAPLSGSSLASRSGQGLSLGKPRGGLSLGTPRNGDSLQRQPPRRLRAADDATRATDTDAISARLSAIDQGYIVADPYTRLLAPQPKAPLDAVGARSGNVDALPARRPPIINIGTYLRCRAIDTLVARFLDLPSPRGSQGKQIISIGAGSDSRFWRIKHDPHLRSKLKHYVELDFGEVTKAKIERIMRHKELAKTLDPHGTGDAVEVTPDGHALHSARYTLLAADLRLLAQDSPSSESAHVRACIEEALSPTCDTLILAECVLAYMAPVASNSLLRMLGSVMPHSFAICYEMCIAGDGKDAASNAPPSRFGSVMLSNLESRNLFVPGASDFSTLTSHARRFDASLGLSLGTLGKGVAISLRQVWLRLDEQERNRLSRLEGLDEVEELEMLLAHYAISWYTHDVQQYSSFLETQL